MRKKRGKAKTLKIQPRQGYQEILLKKRD